MRNGVEFTTNRQAEKMAIDLARQFDKLLAKGKGEPVFMGRLGQGNAGGGALDPAAAGPADAWDDAARTRAGMSNKRLSVYFTVAHPLSGPNLALDQLSA